MKIIGIVLVLLSFDAFAVEGQSSLKKSELFRNKKFTDSHALSDSKLRADDGSLSRWSVKGSLSYFGPTLADWTEPDQPNPDGSIGSYAQAIKGSAMVRYRISSNETISAGTGIAINHPFHGWDRTDANNPFVTYDRAYRVGELQMRTSPGLLIATVPNFTRTGEIGGLTLDQSMVWRPNGYRLGLSLDAGVSWWIYNRAYRPGSVRSGGDGRAQEYSLGFYPGLKYYFNDQWNVYGSYALQFYNPRELSDKGAWWNRTPSARLGVSYAAGRDVYIAPYLSSFFTQAFDRSTTMNILAVFSL